MDDVICYIRIRILNWGLRDISSYLRDSVGILLSDMGVSIEQLKPRHIQVRVKLCDGGWLGDNVECQPTTFVLLRYHKSKTVILLLIYFLFLCRKVNSFTPVDIA